MPIRPRVLLAVITVFAVPRICTAQIPSEAVDQITNWPAPLYWQPAPTHSAPVPHHGRIR